ncbi:hypothetical protein [Amaricoccus sp.]|uniref:hypothetical protein n=1 Tax=Amaricoccus sp. TaxID=1872485 RepID=UPI001B4744BC|nr:hypothetical protein [Amaricoccus sp.]MBP7001429.1 hypothetical protein [Amaricoccus sp.]
MRRAALLAAAAAALAACVPTTGAGPDRATITVAGRDVTIAAPRGFCVDPAATNVSASGAFVLASDCALLGSEGVLGEGDADPLDAVLTASVSAAQLPASGTLPDIERFVATPAGRAALGRSGRPERIKVLATRTRGEVLYVLVEDRGPQPIAGIEPRFWRAFLAVDGRMTVLTVLGFEGAGVDPTAGLALIQRFADTVQAVNRPA